MLYTIERSSNLACANSRMSMPSGAVGWCRTAREPILNPGNLSSNGISNYVAWIRDFVPVEFDPVSLRAHAGKYFGGRAICIGLTGDREYGTVCRFLA